MTGGGGGYGPAGRARSGGGAPRRARGLRDAREAARRDYGAARGRGLGAIDDRSGRSAAARCSTAPAPPPLRDAVVVVDDGRITAVGPAATTPVPAGAEVLDWSDRFVMPGLVDATATSRSCRATATRSASSAEDRCPQALRATANLRPRPRRRHHHACGSWREEHFLDVEVREAIAAGVDPRARGSSCGTRGIAASNGHGRARSSATTAWTRSAAARARTSGAAPTT